MADSALMTLTRLPPVGDAEMFVLADKDGHELKFIVSNAQLKCDPENAVKRAVAQAMARLLERKAT